MRERVSWEGVMRGGHKKRRRDQRVVLVRVYERVGDMFVCEQGESSQGAVHLVHNDESFLGGLRG